MRAKDPQDENAWEEFVTYYDPFIAIVISKMNYRKISSDDIKQIVLIELWKSIGRFDINDERAKFRTWMSRVIRNMVLSYFRKEDRQPSPMEVEHDALEVSSELDAMIEKEWEIHLSRCAMERVSKRFTGKAMSAFQRSLNGESAAEVASELDMSVASVYTLKNRVKKHLILEIQRLQGELEFSRPEA
jgi:RNA polymerase sigma-70 factor (ECF subfamily)